LKRRYVSLIETKNSSTIFSAGERPVTDSPSKTISLFRVYPFFLLHLPSFLFGFKRNLALHLLHKWAS